MENISDNKFVLGITGGVGSGKSTVLSLLREHWSAEVIQADEVARELMEPGGACLSAVAKAFGEDILQPDGSLDRPRLAQIVFASEEKRHLLNSLTHPLVRREVGRQIAESSARLVVYEAALPEEAYMEELCQEIWYIHAPEEVRIERLMASRGYSREKSLAVMRSQRPEEEFRRLADRVIENGGDLQATEKQLQRALQSVTIRQCRETPGT